MCAAIYPINPVTASVRASSCLQPVKLGVAPNSVVQDQVIARAFDRGAADSVVKPFSPTELVARIRAALRRRSGPGWAEPSELLRAWRADHRLRRVTLAGRPVQLTAIEHGLLFELSANAGRVMTYDRLLQRVWGCGAPATRGGYAPREAAPPKPGRRRQQPHLHPQRAPPRLPHGEGGGAGAGGNVTSNGDVVHYIMASSIAGSSHEHAR